MSDTFRACAVIPAYDNPLTVRAVVEAVRAHLPDVLVVDDGSGLAGRTACAALAAEGLATVLRRERNGGKGAAVKDGLREAAARGFTHAMQVDADGQHDTARIPAFLEAGARQPEALVLSAPVYDASAPPMRVSARRFMAFWVALELGRRDLVADAMVGFRLYPVAAALAAGVRGDRMDFDIEVVVRLVRAGTPVINLPVAVRYPGAAEGGVSHFRPVRDNLSFFPMHARLCTSGAWRWLVHTARGIRP